ncbi:MAG: glycosyltransferase family 4 protein [Porticoccus sp.]|nr:glycosyltransferase family 4 protein [Porticoccus sp.]
MIKIANVIEDARLAGPQLRIAAVASRLNKNKYKTTVLIPKKDNDRFKKKLEDFGVEYKELPLHCLTKDKKKLLLFVLYFTYEVFSLWRYLKYERFDIVHVSGGSWQWKGVIAGKLAGCRVLWHLNDTRMPDYIKMVFRFLAKYFSDGFIVAGDKVKKYYLDDLKVRKKIVEVIQAPVDCTSFSSNSVTIDKNIEKYNSVNVVTIANINPVKGLETFIKSAAKLKSNGLNVNFFIVGPVYDSQMSYFDILKKIVTDLDVENIHFLGGVDDVKSILKSANIYVCSSLSEASPTSVWEAMAMGKPVVSTDVGDVSRFIKNGVNGFIVDVNDDEGMMLALSKLVCSPGLRAEFSKKNREIALTQLDVSRCVAKHENVYKSLVK